jgi:hypothetical protein
MLEICSAKERDEKIVCEMKVVCEVVKISPIKISMICLHIGLPA